MPKTKQVRTGHPRFFEILDQMADVHDKKNRDYANKENPLQNFYDAGEGVGITAYQYCMGRVYEKMSRLKKMNRGHKPNFEGIEDSLIDIANLSVIAIILWEEQNKK